MLGLDAFLFALAVVVISLWIKIRPAPKPKPAEPSPFAHLAGTFGSFADIEGEEPVQPKQRKEREVVSRKKRGDDQTACCGGSGEGESCCQQTSTSQEESTCCSSNKEGDSCCKNEKLTQQAPPTKSILILYGTQSGTAEDFAKQLEKIAKAKNIPSVTVGDMAKFDPENLTGEPFVVFIMSTYTNGLPPPTATGFYNWVIEEGENERNGNMMRTVKYAVFGLGNSLYSKHYCTAPRQLDFAMHKMGAMRVWRADADESKDQGEAFDKWLEVVWTNLVKLEKASASEGDDANGAPAEEEYDDEDEDDDDDEDDSEPLVDLEDLGSVMQKGAAADKDKPAAGKQMLSGTQKAVLSKQGYKIIGSHSGVKMCRWTKAMLRGRGGCYKHTFYGIMSHRCMETTPSMACANKCVFCWRHHKNPVGTEWRWEMDDPETIVNGAIENHYKMIKEAKGVPGVKPERLAEAFQIKHCALSLVGEPIIYPEINKYLDLLHSKGISSFMVTNAQFPDRIQQLKPVTQLYISVDAATPEQLKIVDRPLFPDYWERFLACIDELAKKGQRTVFRLTLIKGWNMEEMNAYAKLIKRGQPDFVEVKGVTYCGGKRPQVLMENVPWHDEVVKFTSELCKLVDDTYQLASEHEHSCCVLLANRSKFLKDGVWNTWIDFDKFIELQATGQPFSSLDYMCPTPDWATFGHTQRGFNPVEYSHKLANRPRGSGC
jgi:tRNA wybutosine-synthesizing protein 1